MKLLAKISKISEISLLIGMGLLTACLICCYWVKPEIAARLIIYSFYILCFVSVFWLIAWHPPEDSLVENINGKG